MAIDFNPQGKKTILTVDGGGARGLIPLMALARLERETGQTCHDLFDFMGGTSVGAIIAASLAAGCTANDVIQNYKDFIGPIFKRDYFAIAFRHGFRYIYDKTALREMLRRCLGDKTLADLDHALLLTVKDMARSETIFFVNRGPGAAATQNASLVEVVEASSSVPVFFEPVGDGIDGGIGSFANVCYAATVEALEYFSQEDPAWVQPDNVIHCSFGTGISSNRVPRSQAKTWLPTGWPLWMIDEGLKEAIDVNVQATVRQYGDRIDFRRYQFSLEDQVVRQELGVTIPPGLSSNNLGLDTISPAHLQLMEDIGNAFADGLDFTKDGQWLADNPPTGAAGYPYPSRLPPLTPAVVRQMFDA